MPSSTQDNSGRTAGKGMLILSLAIGLALLTIFFDDLGGKFVISSTANATEHGFLSQRNRTTLLSSSKEPDEVEQQEETEEETNDDFENLYKGQVSKSGVAILPSKRTRRIPEVKKPSLADEALSELKAEQPEIKEENLETEEAPLELSEEASLEEENKSE